MRAKITTYSGVIELIRAGYVEAVRAYAQRVHDIGDWEGAARLEYARGHKETYHDLARDLGIDLEE